MTAPRERIGGRYEVRRELARGGMGRVLLAHDVELDRPVALKTLLDQPDVTSILRLAEEAQLAGQLAHPNIVPVHELGLHQGVPYVAMKFVEGRDLKALVKELRAKDRAAAEQAYGLRRRLRVFLTVCEAIAHAHEQGVIHRDLKPANIMLGPSDDVLVLDWGLAKSLDRPGLADGAGPTASGARLGSPDASGSYSAARRVSSRARQQAGDLTVEGEVVGTPAYMSPEQSEGGKVLDRRADVYSLGAILYELSVLEPPYTGPSLAVIKAVMEGPPPPPRQKNPEVPAPLEAIVLKAMARDREDRYADAAALAEDVEAWLDGRAVSVWRETPVQALVRLASRHKLATGFLAASLVVLAAATTAERMLVGRESRAAELEAENAQRSADEAGTERARAESARTRAAVELACVQAANDAARAAVDFDAVARTAVPLDQLAGSRDVALREVATAQGAIDARTAREALAGEDAAFVASTAASALGRVAGARRAVDHAFARAHLGRAPGKFLALLASEEIKLDLGPEAPLVRARALLRSGREDDVPSVLLASSFPEGPLALEAKVLELTVAQAPLDQLRAAVEAAVAADSTEAWLHLARAECLVRDGDFDAAASAYDRAHALDPVDAWVLGSRLRRLEPIYVKEELFGRHVIDLAHILLKSEEHDAKLAQSLILLFHNGDVGRYEREIAAEAAEAAPLSPIEAGRALAVGYLVARSPEKAEAAAMKVLEKNPEDREGLGLLAEAKLARGDVENARLAAQRGLARHPGDGRLSYVAGELLRVEGRAAEAVPFLERGARTTRLSDRWERLARAYSALDTPDAWEKGIAAGRKALSYDPWQTYSYHSNTDPVPGDPRISRTLGDLRRKQGKLAAAALHYVRALDTSRIFDRIPRATGGVDLVDALLAGAVHEEMGLPDEAVALYRIALADSKWADEARKRIQRLGGK